MSLGGNAAAAFDEWSHLNRMFARDAVLHTLPLEEALSRAFLHIKDNHFHILLLAAVVQASAMDVVLAELGVCAEAFAFSQARGGRSLRGHAAIPGRPRLADAIRKHDPSLISTVSLVRQVDRDVWMTLPSKTRSSWIGQPACDASLPLAVAAMLKKKHVPIMREGRVRGSCVVVWLCTERHYDVGYSKQ